MARLKLTLPLHDRAQQAKDNADRAGWERNQNLERGNPVRTYRGAEFQLFRNQGSY